MDRLIFNFGLAIEGIVANRLRASLTALGIIFGVAAVVAMLGIGSGAQRAILEQMKLIGANSIVIQSNVEAGDGEDQSSSDEESSNSENGKRKWSPGLTMLDLDNIKKIIPDIDKSGAEINMRFPVIANGMQNKSNCIAIEPAFFELNNLEIGSGKNFSESNMINGSSVCIIGKNIETKFFRGESAVGKKIKVDNNWLSVVGVIKQRIASQENLEKLGLQDYNLNVYIPIKTALLRFKNRSKISEDDLGDDDYDPNHNYHQLDRVVLRVSDSKVIQASADIVGRYLERKHNGIKDYNIKIPELLIQQQQKTQETFNIVLAVIAGISLLVGGIGIMNIMLASVLERIKEIGIRRSIGAHKQDIVLQFLFEAVTICFIGGLIGVILGIVTAKLISQSSGIPTVISWWSIVLSFGVAFIVGLVFGLFPAKRASEYDPIIALRTN